MKTQSVNLASLIEAGVTDSDCVGAAIAATDFQRLIVSANKGDCSAARELLAVASTYLGSDTFGPMAPELRRYLARAFAYVSLGKSADVALNLKRPGRPQREHRTKLWIGHLIHKEMTGGKSLEKACQELEDHIRAGLRIYEDFYGFSEPPDYKTLEGIYTEVKPELDGLYDEVHTLNTP